MDTREGTGNAKLEEDQDFTGDSGFSASSKFYDDSDPYCVVDLWRRPPPNRLLPAGKKGVLYIVLANTETCNNTIDCCVDDSVC